jgi:pseudaminic acid cytidylyltransferase
MNIALIPARGGSKRIPAKNIKPFLGRPIIEYSIERLLECKDIFEHVIVSTDSKEIAEIAKKAGAQVPFIRPPKLSDDHTGTADVILHAIEESEKIYKTKVEMICCVYATAPFARTEDIRAGYEIITHNETPSVFSVTTFPFPIFRAHKMKADGTLEMFLPEHESTRSNDLPEAYHDAGQFYWLDAGTFKKTKKIYAKDAMPVVLPRVLVQDIDTPEDWETAEILYRLCEKKGLL